MGISEEITLSCDYPECKAGQNGKIVVVYNKTEIEAGRAELPELAKYFVVVNYNGTKTFCCQLHAAEFFLPPGYEAVQKQVIQLPPRRSHHKKLVPSNWKDLPTRHEAVEQADGSPDNGQEEE